MSDIEFERCHGGASHVFAEVSGSTVEKEQRPVNIDSVANRIIIKRIRLLDQLNRLRKSALRTANITLMWPQVQEFYVE